ncbi:hypothetical protein HMPREF9372_3342 [Sporosarcina newyorkensis 2681]|uniref:bAvd-like domain-containing protein n=1 Tax=Sporosarcina newyorkensis 2681 TaxID=1027292 RepID=F9DX11_9BACL|nr:four helix bundle protein [Sporosarcina newyorkensis]EGQ21059.1 hypothetical protein HMPREF9372_3342 [Sporosarcina newyorkensis 2681]
MRSTDLKIYQKAERLYADCEPVLKNFPRYERLGLSLDINNAFNSLLSTIILANEVMHFRKKYQAEIDGYLSLIIVHFNTAKRKKYITEKRNLLIQNSVMEIGRMLGGWKKATA